MNLFKEKKGGWKQHGNMCSKTTAKVDESKPLISNQASGIAGVLPHDEELKLPGSVIYFFLSKAFKNVCFK